MRVKCLAQEHNTMIRPGFEPGSLDPESSVLTTRPAHLLWGWEEKNNYHHFNLLNVFNVSVSTFINDYWRSLQEATSLQNSDDRLTLCGHLTAVCNVVSYQ